MPHSTPTPHPSTSPVIDPARVGQQITDLIDVSRAWLGTHWFEAVIAIAIGVVVYLGIRAAKHLGSRLCAHDQTTRGWYTIFGRAISKTGHVFSALLAARLVAGYASPPEQVLETIRFLFTIAATFQMAIWAREIILGAIEHRASSEHYSGEALLSAMSLIRLLVSFAVFAIAFVVVLDNLGVNVTGLVAGLGVGGIAIGLAAQGIFADLFAALAIIFDRPFRRGDVIAYDQTGGTVESIGLKSTRIRPATGELRVIANKQLLDKEIQNLTVRDARRVSFTLGVAQWTPPETMQRLPEMLKELVEAGGQKFAQAGFVAFGASSYDFLVEFDTPADWASFFKARHEIGLAIIERFNKECIDLAYPTQTTFTAAPDGKLVMPYPEALPVIDATRRAPQP
jgi:small-conductance mechanosensitive channel